MSTTLLIALAAWIGLNAAVFAALVRSSPGLRHGRGPAIFSRRSYGASIDGYASVLLLRVLVQACRVTGAPAACVLLRDPQRPDALVPVASHGLDEDLIGHRIETPGNGWRLTLTGADGGPIDAHDGAAAPIVRATIGDCGYLWAAAGPAAELGDRQIRLLGEFAGALARALDDVDRAAHLDESIGRGLALLCGDDEAGAAGRYAALARSVGERLGLDAAAAIELEIAARVQHAVPVAPAAAVRALPGFEAVGIALHFAGERWDGGGPHGLRGDRIPLASRILAVCDALGVLSDTSLRAVQGKSGSAYDPDVVAALSNELLGPVPELGAPADDWADGDLLFAGVVAA